MSNAIDPIEELAYGELLISCQVEGCQNLFQNCLDEPATDPVEVWAKKMAQSARDIGWSSDFKGKVLCPLHSNLNEATQ